MYRKTLKKQLVYGRGPKAFKATRTTKHKILSPPSNVISMQKHSPVKKYDVPFYYYVKTRELKNEMIIIQGTDIIHDMYSEYVDLFQTTDNETKFPTSVMEKMSNYLAILMNIYAENKPHQCSIKTATGYSGFNRTWECCGVFAPHLYFYEFINHSNLANTGFPIAKYATLFYKMISGYGIDRDSKWNSSWNINCTLWHDFTWLSDHLTHKPVEGAMNKIVLENLHDTPVENTPVGNKPMTLDELNAPDLYAFMPDMKINEPYIFNIIGRGTLFTGEVDKVRCNTFHHMYAKRISKTHVIMADTWTWQDMSCSPKFRNFSIRAMKYKNFKKMINIINANKSDLFLNQILAQELSAPYGKDKRPILNTDIYIVPMRNDVLSKLIHELVFDEETYKKVLERHG